VASIVGKKQGGKTYYYLVESARVGGKPRIVSQRYLGSAEEIAARLSESGPGEPDRTRHLAFGDLAAVWSMLERLKVAEIIDEVVGSRRTDAQAPVGTYVALAVANRVVDPCSKRGFADWWKKTAGDRLIKIPASALDHRRFWDAMDAISEAHLREIERRIVAHMVEAFDVDLSGLVLDMTNFATYIDTANHRAPIAQRGHAKQKRTDLRLVGLGLVVSTDGGIPLVSHAYSGNKPDVTQFPELVNELVARFGGLGGDPAGLTLVFDAGQNSEDNYELLDGAPLHFVGSLPPSDHPDLLAVPKARYRAVDKTRFRRPSGLRDRQGGLRRRAPHRPHPLAEPARQAVPRLRPDPGQGPPPAGRARGAAGPGQDPQAQGEGAGRDRADPQTPLAVSGDLHHAVR
jgi:hypothetical protein